MRQILTLAGTIPFIFCALCLLLGVESLSVLGSSAYIEYILSVYGLVIATFMAGSHWGQHLHLDNKWSSYLPIVSNINAVILWLGYLILSFTLFVALLILSFSCLLVIDKQLRNNDIISRSYFRIRCVATAIVNAALIIAIIAIYSRLGL